MVELLNSGGRTCVPLGSYEYLERQLSKAEYRLKQLDEHNTILFQELRRQEEPKPTLWRLDRYTDKERKHTSVTIRLTEDEKDLLQTVAVLQETKVSSLLRVLCVGASLERVGCETIAEYIEQRGLSLLRKPTAP